MSFQGSKLVPLCLQLAKAMGDSEWRQVMAPAIVKAYTSPDRGMRMALLENLESYSDRMENKMVVDKIWPNLITGLGDSVAAIREAALKAILPLAPKLSDRILNNELLRLLAKTQMDPESGIRTNTTILIGRLAPLMSTNTKKTVLVPAFARSLKDTFVHARVAGLMALIATGDSFEAEDLAKQVLPAMAPCLLDKEKIVRDQADKGFDVFLKRVREVSKTLPETMLPPEGTEAAAAANAIAALKFSATSGGGDGLAASATSAASALAGWAMSSAMSSFAAQSKASDLQNTSMDSRIGATANGSSSGGWGGSSTSLSSAAPTPPPSVLPVSPQRPNGFKSHSSTSPALSSAAQSFSQVTGDDWDSMDDTPAAVAAPAAARAGLPGIVGGSKKLSLGGAARKKTSLADTILQESATASSSVSRPAARKSLAIKVAPVEEDAWEEAAPTLAPPSEAVDLADSTELTAAAFTQPNEPLVTANPEPEPPQPEEVGEISTWATMDDDAAVIEATPPASAATPAKALSKEEKRAEMQRQREERKARMAAFKSGR